MTTLRAVPNLVFRRVRGQQSPGEFAASVRRAAREIGEQVACDARYIGRVEAGEIRCPNYAYERVFLHMFPGLTLTDLGFSPREAVRGRAARIASAAATASAGAEPDPPPVRPPDPAPATHRMAPPARTDSHIGGHIGSRIGSHIDGRIDSRTSDRISNQSSEESDVLRRAFMTSGTATVAATSLSLGAPPAVAVSLPGQRRVGEAEVGAVEAAVRQIRLLDDRHGADGLYRGAAQPLRAAYALLDTGAASRGPTAGRLHAGAGELSISVGWLAHDSGRFDEARSHYAEALATARVAGDSALEAHAFCNMAFLARDAGTYREAVLAAQAGQRAARQAGSPRLLSLLALREAGGWAGLGDRTGCERALTRARALFEHGPAQADPEWMSFFGEPEVEMLEAQCRAALGDWPSAARHAYRATVLQDPHFARNLALYRAELAGDLARSGSPDEASAAGHQVLDLLDDVRSSRIRTMLAFAARALLAQRRLPDVRAFLDRHDSVLRRPRVPDRQPASALGAT